MKRKLYSILEKAAEWWARICAPDRCSYIYFTGVVSLVCTLLFGLADVIVPAERTTMWSNIGMLPCQWLCNWAIIAVMALYRPVFVVLMPVYALLYTVVTYFRYTLGTVLDRSVVELSLGTDIGTSMSMLSTPLIITMSATLLLSVVAVVWRWRRVRVRGVRWQWLLLAVTVVVVTGSVPPVNRSLYRRHPYNLPVSVISYLRDSRFPKYYRFNFSLTSASTDEERLTVVFILGESVRADHMGINGYHRQTTPYLAAERNLVSLPGVYSQSYFTDRAVPRLMTRADTIDDGAAYDEQSFITLFRNAGFATVWYANQADTPCLRYYRHETDRLHEAEQNFVPNEAKGKFLDEDLLEWYRADLRRHDEPLQLLIMHQLNCHWVYTSKYPDSFSRYTPVMTHDEVLRNSVEELVNAYDNCILYADSIWQCVIDPLRNRNAIVIYQSDHGEALGDSGKYLHGADYPGTHNPAAWVWYSDEYARRHPDKIAALQANAPLDVTSTYLFHTILDAASITTGPLQPRQSLMRPMRVWHER